MPTRPTIVRLAILSCAAFVAIVAAQASPPPPPAPPSASAAPETTPAARPAVDAIPQATLQEMYRAELGRKYNPQDATRLHDAHVLVEQFFAAATAQERKALVVKLEATGLDPNL